MLLAVTWSRASYAEPGMDILWLHSVEVIATTGTLDEEEEEALLTSFKIVQAISYVNPPTSKLGLARAVVALPGKMVSLANDGERAAEICRQVPSLDQGECFVNASLFRDAQEAFDDVILVYNILNGTDDLNIYAGSKLIYDKVVSTRGSLGKYLLNRIVHFSNNTEGLELALYEDDDNVLDREPDLIVTLNFGNLEAQSKTEVRLVSPSTGAVYALTYSILKNAGEWSKMYPPDRTREGLMAPSPLTLKWDSNAYKVFAYQGVSLNNFFPEITTGRFDSSGNLTLMSTPYDYLGWDVPFNEAKALFALKYRVQLRPGYITETTQRTDGCRWNPDFDEPGSKENGWNYFGYASEACSVTLRALKDSDLDGVADERDICPDTDPDNSTIDRNGCSAEQRDTDEDGVTDDIDQCVDTPAKVQVSTLGCADRDGDDTPDSDDAFPDDPNEDTDTDGDGVGDNADDFPGAVSELTQSHGDGQKVRVMILQRARTSTCSLESVEVEPLKAPRGMWSYAFEVGFKLDGCAAGETVDVSIDFGKSWPNGARAHKVKGGKIGKAIRNASTNGTIVSYAVTDNGPLDTDPADGAISDPVTMAVTLPVPTVQLWHLIMLGALLALLARRKLHIA